MIHYKRTTFWLSLLVVLFFSACSDKITQYERQEDKIKPLQTTVKTVILHEDYIKAERESQTIKDFIIRRIVEKISMSPKFHLVHIQKGGALPTENDFKGQIILTGNIWTQSGQTSGRDIAIVRRTESGKTYSRSWDELEHRRWKQNVLQTVISLNFLEITDKTKLLRGVITSSNDRHYQLSNNSRKIEETQSSDVFKIPELSPGHIVISVDSRLDNLEVALDSLASKAINKLFESL